jgi:hypothetical protein
MSHAALNTRLSLMNRTSPATILPSPQDDGAGQQDRLSSLVPPELARILEDRPITGHEDPDKYDALLTDLILAYEPRDAIEYILVKDLAWAQWHANRLKGMRQTVIDLALPEAAWSLLGKAWLAARQPDPALQADTMAEEEEDEELDDFDDFDDFEEGMLRAQQAREDLTRLIRLSLQGNHEARQELEGIMQHAAVTNDMLHTSSLLSSMSRLSMLEGMLAETEKRRDHLMRQIEGRRTTSAVMTRGLLRQDIRASATDVQDEDQGTSG